MNTQNFTLEQVQRYAIDYRLRARFPDQLRTVRCFARIVRDYCKLKGYTQASTDAVVKDAFDVYKLERNAE